MQVREYRQATLYDLLNGEIPKALGLTDEQKQSFAKLEKTYDPKLRELLNKRQPTHKKVHDCKDEDRKKQALEDLKELQQTITKTAEEYRKKLTETLTEDQKKKLPEMQVIKGYYRSGNQPLAELLGGY